LVAIPTLPSCGGAPSVNIISPSDGSLSTSSTVKLTGTASGSDYNWSQASGSDFANGSMEELSDTNGSLALNRTRMPVYDDFDDNELDNDRWNVSEHGAMHISEAGSRLRINSTSGFCWSGADIASTWLVPTAASIDLISIKGFDFVLTLYLYQDNSNFAFFRIYSFSYFNPSNTNASKTRAYWGYCSAGTYEEKYLGPLLNMPNNFKMVFTGNQTMFYVNNDNRGIGWLPKLNMTVRMEAYCYDENGWMDSYLDNCTWGYLCSEAGNFTSSVYDTSSADTVLKAVRWNATVPNGSGLSVMVRSSDNEKMSSATAWTTVANGQDSGLPAVKRYLQYRAAFTSPDGLETAQFRDIEIIYIKPVARVEVSVDNNATWILATGTGSWNVSLQLSDNTTLIWVRVTDVMGETTVTSIRVEVDTTPPAGSVVIDGDAPFTTDHDVSLALNATDHYGMASMMVSENPGFEGAAWTDYSPTLGFRLSEGDGIKTVYARFRDANGWDSRTHNDSILLDTHPPVGSVLIDGGAEYTHNATVTLSFDASDPSGVSALLISNTLDFAGIQWIDYESALHWGLIAGSGERSVHVKFRDACGHVSPAVDDSILVDLAAPSVALSINGGAVYTRYRNVTVALTPAEDFQPVLMQVWEGAGTFPADFPWAPYQSNVELVLSAGDGQKVVSARLADAAGNIGPSAMGSIVLDTAAPVTKLAGYPEVSYRAAMNVSWDGIDATSGVLWYDVQYRTGDGQWTDWFQHTSSTSAAFTGEDGKTYSFRARAQDKAGNVEDFPATVGNTVKVQLSKGALTIISPAPKATLSGKARISGQCQPDPEGRDPVQVLLRVDDGPWQLAEGTSSWSFYLDTTKLSDGNYVIRVKSFDGTQYSAETERSITVKNPGSQGFDVVPLLAVALVLAVVALVAMAFMMRRKPVPVAQPVK